MRQQLLNGAIKVKRDKPDNVWIAAFAQDN